MRFASAIKSGFKIASLVVLGASLIACESNNSSSTSQKPSSSNSSSSSSSSSSMQGFSLNFEAQVDGQVIDCSGSYSGLGLEQDNTIAIGDLRFYISDLKFFDEQGAELTTQLSSNEFQYSDEVGAVALVDLSGSGEGNCEGTARTNSVVVGQVDSGQINAVSFAVGVPQPLMKAIINAHTENNAPQPLNEMYWNWASGYRHFVFNFKIEDTLGAPGQGFVHVGSRGCGGGAKALSDSDSCTYVNTARVSFDDFDPSQNTVVLDLVSLLADLSFKIAAGENQGQPGVSCHSNIENQPDCSAIFSRLGIDPITGNAGADSNAVFIMQ